jgi:ribosome biogenesis GTPase
VVLLTKADLAPGAGGVEAALSTAAAAAPGVSVHAVSARDGAGLAPLAPYLGAGATAVLVGPSGAGKSTLVNALLGAAVQPVGAVREADGKGRHTTTARDLLRLPGGALLIDSPGVREFGLAADASDLEGSHADVAALAAQCRFRDCRHEGEPGCAVAAAVEAGRLGAERLAGFRKLARESGYHERRDDPRRAREHERAACTRASSANPATASGKAGRAIVLALPSGVARGTVVATWWAAFGTPPALATRQERTPWRCSGTAAPATR